MPLISFADYEWPSMYPGTPAARAAASQTGYPLDVVRAVFAYYADEVAAGCFVVECAAAGRPAESIAAEMRRVECTKD